MDYAELPLPPELEDWVAALWTASITFDARDWTEFEAVPDGCIELIRRAGGSSFWRREQPELFATGLATTTAKLRLSAGSSFVGVKLWPWAWAALGGPACRDFEDDWIPVAGTSPMAVLMNRSPEAIIELLSRTLGETEPPRYARAVLRERTVADIARRAGMPPRQLQRAFARDIGMPPRAYLRLLRFRGALSGVAANETLAETAAEAGYADQAHMAREFRSLAGLPPSVARTRANGPFV